MGWRLIDTDIADPYYVTAADDAISQARKEKRIQNTLHFYRRSPAAVSVGRSRKIHNDINLEECLKNNVKIVRRTTGGGSIYTDEQCLIYSLVFDRETGELHSSDEIFENVCHSLINTLERFNINAIYKPPNDILLNEKKISGSAQIKKDNIVLIHGTLLLDTNLGLMNTVLKKPRNVMVSTIRREMGFAPSMKEIKEELRKEFEMYFDINFEKTRFSTYENDLIDKLLKERYLNDKWNFMR
ncbi:MAG: lipoate--protein ligase family protein [Thermoplasmatales archaeon]|nr:MAG: lipoate--protein ligase family protein [Thermoplasmatales archaeon]